MSLKNNIRNINHRQFNENITLIYQNKWAKRVSIRDTDWDSKTITDDMIPMPGTTLQNIGFCTI